MIIANSIVRKIHPFDGTRNAGKPLRRRLRVLLIAPLTTEGCQTHHVAILSDGTWEYVWNLSEVVEPPIAQETPHE